MESQDSFWEVCFSFLALEHQLMEFVLHEFELGPSPKQPSKPGRLCKVPADKSLGQLLPSLFQCPHLLTPGVQQGKCECAQTPGGSLEELKSVVSEQSPVGGLGVSQVPKSASWVWRLSQSNRGVHPGKMGLFSKSGLSRNLSLSLDQMFTFGLIFTVSIISFCSIDFVLEVKCLRIQD